MKRAVIYARVSKQREESVSLDAQVEQCTARARQLGADVVRVFIDEGISGREARNRHAFQQAKAFCQVAGVHYFITWSTSRFARNMLELFHSQEELKAIGTRLECLNADIDDETDAGFVNRAIHGLMDEMYSRQVARDTLRSQKQAAAAGFFTGGGVPFGYRSVRDGSRSRLDVHPDEVPVVLRLFGLALEQGLGAQAIAEKLNLDGHLRRGRRWTKNAVSYILRNEVYTGVRTFNRTHRRSGKAKPRDQWVQVASHPAIVSRDDFERIQTMIDERVPHQHTGGAARSTFLFTGITVCGICSGRLQIRTGKSRGGDVYSYYACLAHKRGAPRCLFRPVRADLFDDWLLGQVLDHVVTPAAMAQALQDLMSAGADWYRDREAKRAELVAQLRDEEGKRERLFELLETHGKATPGLAQVTQRLKERAAAIEQLQEQLQGLEVVPSPRRPVEVEPETAVEVMRELIQRADVKRQRAFLAAFIERVTVRPDGVDVDYRPEALLEAGSGSGVRSNVRWLPVSCSLRTRRVSLGRPVWPRRRVAVGGGRGVH